MKSASLIMILGSWFAALDPNNNGCGAAAGTNEGNGATAVDAGDAASPIDTTGAALVDCGALGKHAFCEDFSGAMPGKFETQDVSTGIVAFENGALVASTQKPPSGTRTVAYLKKPIPIDGERFSLSWVETVDDVSYLGKNGTNTNGITLGDNAYYLALGHGSDGDTITETSLAGGLYIQVHQIQSPIPHGRPVKVALDLDLDAATISVAVDGATVMDREPLKYAPKAPQRATLSAGVLVDNLLGPEPAKVTIDDVTLDVQLAK
jgi:hypothetical protein